MQQPGSKLRARALFLATIFADSVDLKSVAGRCVLIPATDFIFDVPYFRRKKLNRTSALRAHHVMVTAAVILVFIAGDAVVKSNLTRQSTLRQQLQSAVNRGKADAAVFFLNQAMKFVKGEMLARLEKRLQDRVALGGLLQADAFQVAVQNGLRFPDHLVRNGRLIVNALLQHVLVSMILGWRSSRQLAEHLCSFTTAT